MPWHTTPNHPDCPTDSPWAVVKDETDEVVGCHESEEQANEQVAALYASEADDVVGDDGDMSADPLLTAVYDAFAIDGEPVDTPVLDEAPLDPAAYVGGYWRGVLAVEGVETGDYPIREFAPGALEWRDLPLPLHHLVAAHDGESDIVQIGSIDMMWRDEDRIYGCGRFDMDLPHALDVHRLVVKRMLRGVSVGVDKTTEADIEVVYPETGPADEIDDDGMDPLEGMLFAEPEKVIFHRGRVMEATVVSTPALQEAYIELVRDDEWDDYVTAMQNPPETLVAAGGYTSIVVVAQPADPESLAVAGGLPPEELHVTLGYFGDVSDAPDGLVDTLAAWVADHGAVDFAVRVGGVARMGDDDPQAVVLLVEAPELAELRSSLEQVAEPDRTHPHFTPHITLGYGIDMPDTWPAEARFDRLELWAGDEHTGDAGAVTAASAPVLPPVAWFRNPALPGPTPPTYDDSGYCYGHLAVWGVCHTSFSNVCVTPPRATGADYGYYRKGDLVTAEGEHVAVGQLTLGAHHAPATLGSAPAAAHYDHTGHAVADVAVGEDQFGIWFAGATRPHVDDRTLRTLRAGGLSGDWRKVGGHWRLVGSLVVNVPGFPIPRVRTHVSDGEQTALVASGMMLQHPTNVIPFAVGEQLRSIVGRDIRSRAAALRRSVHPSNHH